MRGAAALTNAELIAILLRTGSAGENVLALSNRVLSSVDGLRGLGKAGFEALAEQRSMGEAKACQLLAAVELGKRVAFATPELTRKIGGPTDVYALLYAEMALLEQEVLKVLLLSTRNDLVAVKEVYRGSVNTIQVRIADIFREAVREGVPNIIMVHNHPSGDADPSAEDVALTRQAREAGALLGIEVCDHIVIARDGWVSMQERGLTTR
jgi:DNA repair protein RadC